MAEYGFIFDIGGVFVENEVNERSYVECMGNHGCCVSSDYVKGARRLNFVDKFDFWKQDLGLGMTLDEFDLETQEIQLEMIREIGSSNYEFRNVLKYLNDQGCLTGVATSSGEKRAHNILGALRISDYMDPVLTRDNVANNKPDPEMYERIIDVWGIPPDHCFVVDDSDKGIIPASDCGMKTIRYGENSICSVEADYLARSPFDVREIFDEFRISS